jgi:hypothetical protein
LLHRFITVPVPVPDTGVLLHVAPLDDDVTVADNVGVAAAAMVEAPMSAPPEMRAKRPTTANALVSLICDTTHPPPRLPGSRQRRATRAAGRISIQYSTPSRQVKSSILAIILAICRCFLFVAPSCEPLDEADGTRSVPWCNLQSQAMALDRRGDAVDSGSFRRLRSVSESCRV